MLSRGMSRPDMVKATGIAENTFRRRMLGLTPFSAYEIGLAAHALGMSVSEMLRAEGFEITGPIVIEGDENVVNVGSGSIVVQG